MEGTEQALRSLSHDDRAMIARGKKPTVVVAALARELAGFVWAIGQEMRTVMAT